MITAVEPSSFRTRALGISLVLHFCGLALVAMLLPLWHTSEGYGLLDEARQCATPCGRVFAIRIEHRARAAATSGLRRIASALLPMAHPKPESVAAQHKVTISVVHHPHALARATAPREGKAAKAQLSWTGDAGKNPNVSVGAPPTDVQPVASRLQPNTISTNPGEGVETPPPAQTHTTQVSLGPANWGSSFDVPALRDEALYDELIAKLPKSGSVTITVDDQGRAKSVVIDAPGLDAATIDDLRRRLLAALYAPVERDGIAFDGTLRIKP
jgi:hypothetical protein